MRPLARLRASAPYFLSDFFRFLSDFCQIFVRFFYSEISSEEGVGGIPLLLCLSLPSAMHLRRRADGVPLFARVSDFATLFSLVY